MTGRQGRVVVVTGGTGRLGREVVRWFLDAGDSVHVPYAGAGGVAELQTFLGSDQAGRVTFHRADLTSWESVERVFAAVREAGGRVDVLANIVGAFAYASLEETDAALWRKMLEVNATTAFLGCRAAVPLMRAERWGRIVNVASVDAVDHGVANKSAYSAAKAAVVNLTESLAKELAGTGVTVNVIAPTTMDTPENRQAMPDVDPATFLSPAAVARVVGFLAGDEAAVVNGTVVKLAPAAPPANG